MYATDECTKSLQKISNIILDLHLEHQFLNTPGIIFNDNSACVCWINSFTNKDLHHPQIRENTVKENVQSDFIKVKHITGAVNPADLFTREIKKSGHF